MIEKMHEKTNSFAFKLIFTAVSLSFVLGGVSVGGSLLYGDDNAVAKVNGESIDQQTFSAARSREQNILLSQMGEDFWKIVDNPETAKQFNQGVLNKLIDERLLRQYMTDLKLGVTADQIKSAIVHDASFQKDGRFSNELYQMVLRQNNISADRFASIVAEGILSSQLEEGLASTHFMTPVQQEALAKFSLQSREYRAAILPLAEAAQKQSVTDAEVQAYFEANQAKFAEPEKLSVEYFSFTPADVAKNIKVSDEQIKNYYEINKARFVTQGEARLAHIQLANAEAAKEVEAALQAGQDFAELAKIKSADPLSANQGGDLGWAKPGVFPSAFEQAANNLQAGQFSQPVQVDGAFHIIKVLERKPTTALSLDEVKAQIKDRLTQEETAAKYSEIIGEISNKANQLSLAELAQLAGVEVQKNEQFTPDNLPQALDNEKITNVLFAKDFRTTGELSEAIDLSTAAEARSMFLKVSQFEASRPQTFEEAKAQAESALKQDKAEKALTAQAQDMVEKLTKGESVSISFSPKATSRYADSALSPVLAQDLFAMPKPLNGPSYKASRAANGDVVVLALDSVTDGSLADFQQVAQAVEWAERADLTRVVVQDLRERASIDINEELLDQQSTSH
ncbi:peptidylprolyl isomerase [Pasteurellaceae bacterium RH1A]|nr:peptidylprolyl isomerase [Pasteurellaceae bacterium RH1A]